MMMPPKMPFPPMGASKPAMPKAKPAKAPMKKPSAPKKGGRGC